MLKFRGFSIISRRYVAEATEMIIGQPVDEDGHLWSLTDHPWFFSDLIRVGLPDTPVTYQGK